MEALTYEPNKRGWLEALEIMQRDIPDYAEWRIPDLIDSFLRYHDLLLSVAEDPDYREGCADLLRHSGFIQKCILDTRNSNPWAPFTRAAYELHRDIDQLRTFLLEPVALPMPVAAAQTA